MFRVRLLQPGDDTSAFESGEEILDEYLKRFALQMQGSGGPLTYVALSDSGGIVGYYSLVSSRIDRADPPDERLTKGMGQYPIPTTLLARLAVGKGWQGQGIGTDLILHAFVMAARTADQVGSRAIEVDVLYDGLQTFYERAGFKDVHPGRQPRDLNMYVLMKDIRRTLRDQGFNV